ncbi:glutathione peroxidase [Pseudoalteromonas rubra]|uniref:Glutathione peroxidase n=1 Tax=Pseudoalteromonas rubra TaxID=43658 RepID=A0A5S3WMN0_9GAMM|nr:MULTISPECIES: glutathione peroxidase [Pseudoalteromonas]MCO7188467.1 glutathione peroxidase [Pseudoalteromonas sp. XMcav2-N]TMP29103.1 glutathione peroxidase [Pseudoalteromonas rubra]TMP31260.1 glutathione peroxidase [Pseudoalteromonas rubra]TMP33532.1 glutathione peroxidase [Pseudoalteromonas rubra]
MENIYRFSVKLLNGETLTLRSLQGRPVLIVNIASKCSFAPQLSALEKLYKKYHPMGLEIIAFPCHQFGRNEPLENEMLREFYQSHFNLSFHISEKVLVNGPDAHPLFNYLKVNTRGIAQNRAIKWNFTKFLVNSEGVLLSRYAPRTKPETLKSIIESQVSNESRPIQFAKV